MGVPKRRQPFDAHMYRISDAVGDIVMCTGTLHGVSQPRNRIGNKGEKSETLIAQTHTPREHKDSGAKIKSATRCQLSRKCKREDNLGMRIEGPYIWSRMLRTSDASL